MALKRIIAAILGAITLLTLVSSCSGGNDKSVETETQAETEGENLSKLKFYVTYPDYNTKAFTVSYDDGTIQEKKIMELAKKYGIGVTFAPNTGTVPNGLWWGAQGSMEHEGYTVWVQRPSADEISTFYDGFEIASHTATHINLASSDDATIKREVADNKDYLEKLTNHKIIGITYPGNSYDEHSIELLKSYGIIYGRRADVNYSFELPTDFMQWVPTSHDAYPEVPQLANRFLFHQTKRLTCFYIWGHAYELDKPSLIEGTTRWENLEALFEKMGTSGKVWCATNGEIAVYVLATRECEETDDYYWNKSSEIVYAIHGENKLVINPGEKYIKATGKIEKVG